MRIIWCYFSMNSQIDRSIRKNNLVLFQYELLDRSIGKNSYKQFVLMFSARQELWSDSSSHVEGWLCDPIILELLRDCTSESTDPRPHFQALHYRLCSVLSIATLLFFIVPITKINIYYHYYTFISISLPNQCTYTNYHCIWCVGDTRDFFLFGSRVL